MSCPPSRHSAIGARRRSRPGSASLALIGLSLLSVTAGAQTPTLDPTDFVYLGAFRLACTGDACAYNLTDLGSAPSGGLWVTDHVYDYAIRRIAIPSATSMSRVYADLPEAATLEGPLATAGCPGEATDISGVEGIGSEAASTCRDWYNVTGEYTPAFYRRPSATIQEIGPRTLPFHPNKYGAYLFTLPGDWAALQGLGTRTLVTGFSREAGANGGSQGPALFAFDHENPADAIDLLWYREIYPGCPYEGDCDFPGYESADSWMGADWVRSADGDAVMVAGVKAGSTCYGLPEECGDPCRSSKGYHGYPYTGMILFYHPDDLAASLAGTVEPYEVVPYAQWTLAELWSLECPEVGGLAFDENAGRLYVAERLAGPFGQGVIHVYELLEPPPLFADGFELGTAFAWSRAHPPPS